jgi:hypothetical protein
MSDPNGSPTTATFATEAHQAAMQQARSSPRDHVPRHISTRDLRLQILGTGALGHFNNRLAVIITRAIGSMWAAYVFVLIALVSFPQAWSAFASGDRLTGITWLSQSFLQLVLLPVILVGQRVISATQDARAETDHETLTALQAINVQQLQILETLAAMRKTPAEG